MNMQQHCIDRDLLRLLPITSIPTYYRELHGGAAGNEFANECPVLCVVLGPFLYTNTKRVGLLCLCVCVCVCVCVVIVVVVERCEMRKL